MLLPAFATLLIIGCPAEQKPAQPVKAEKPAHVVEFERTWLKEYIAKNRKRINGVQLDATVDVSGDELLIRWEIDYNGPRPPLTILKPLYPDQRRQTHVRLIVPSPTEVKNVIVWPTGRWVIGGAPPAIGKDGYVTVGLKESARGTFTVPLKYAVVALAAELKVTGPEQLPRDVYVELVHAPYLHGFEHGLDSWTVEKFSDQALHSVPRWVSILKWPHPNKP